MTIKLINKFFLIFIIVLTFILLYIALTLIGGWYFPAIESNASSILISRESIDSNTGQDTPIRDWDFSYYDGAGYLFSEKYFTTKKIEEQDVILTILDGVPLGYQMICIGYHSGKIQLIRWEGEKLIEEFSTVNGAVLGMSIINDDLIVLSTDKNLNTIITWFNDTEGKWNSYDSTISSIVLSANSKLFSLDDVGVFVSDDTTIYFISNADRALRVYAPEVVLQSVKGKEDFYILQYQNKHTTYLDLIINQKNQITLQQNILATQTDDAMIDLQQVYFKDNAYVFEIYANSELFNIVIP